MQKHSFQKDKDHPTIQESYGMTANILDGLTQLIAPFTSEYRAEDDRGEFTSSPDSQENKPLT